MKSRVIFAALAASALLVGCTANGYDEGDGRYSYLRADFVDAHTNADRRVDYVCTDDGERLAVERPFTVSWITVADSVYRALLYYNKVESESGASCASAVSVGRVPVLGVVPREQAGEIRTDPVIFESVWLSANKKYVNIGFAVKTGKPGDDSAVQAVGVIGEGVTTLPDGRRRAELRLCHDQGGVPEYYSSYKYVSIRTADMAAETVRIRINTYSGEVEKEITLR